MSIDITSEQQRLVETIFEAGDYDSQSDVLSSALELLRQHQQLGKAISNGLDDLDNGSFTTYGASDRTKFKADIIAEAAARKTPSGR
jgi:Arc/MetJ-type ribon-helix-helix transcriptional regulator